MGAGRACAVSDRVLCRFCSPECWSMGPTELESVSCCGHMEDSAMARETHCSSVLSVLSSKDDPESVSSKDDPVSMAQKMIRRV